MRPCLFPNMSAAAIRLKTKQKENCKGIEAVRAVGEMGRVRHARNAQTQI